LSLRPPFCSQEYQCMAMQCFNGTLVRESFVMPDDPDS
jgi:hypothetical protein